jgi:hypothetical protein
MMVQVSRRGFGSHSGFVVVQCHPGVQGWRVVTVSSPLLPNDGAWFTCCKPSAMHAHTNNACCSHVRFAVLCLAVHRCALPRPAHLSLPPQSIFPELHKGCHAFMRHKDILLSPGLLRTYGIEYMQVGLMTCRVPCCVQCRPAVGAPVLWCAACCLHGSDR